MSLQKTWIKALDSYDFIFRSLYEPFEVSKLVNRETEISQISLKISLFVF